MSRRLQRRNPNRYRRNRFLQKIKKSLGMKTGPAPKDVKNLGGEAKYAELSFLPWNLPYWDNMDTKARYEFTSEWLKGNDSEEAFADILMHESAYLNDDPQKENIERIELNTVLDLDAMAESEGDNWIFNDAKGFFRRILDPFKGIHSTFCRARRALNEAKGPEEIRKAQDALDQIIGSHRFTRGIEERQALRLRECSHPIHKRTWIEFERGPGGASSFRRRIFDRFGKAKQQECC